MNDTPQDSAHDSTAGEAPIVFYCRDCKKVVEKPVRKGQKYEYSCPDCKSDRVSFGTRQAIADFFQAKILKK